jgi:hypothetical protein
MKLIEKNKSIFVDSSQDWTFKIFVFWEEVQKWIFKIYLDSKSQLSRLIEIFLFDFSYLTVTFLHENWRDSFLLTIVFKQFKTSITKIFQIFDLKIHFFEKNFQFFRIWIVIAFESFVLKIENAIQTTLKIVNRNHTSFVVRQLYSFSLFKSKFFIHFDEVSFNLVKTIKITKKKNVQIIRHVTIETRRCAFCDDQIHLRWFCNNKKSKHKLTALKKDCQWRTRIESSTRAE